MTNVLESLSVLLQNRQNCHNNGFCFCLVLQGDTHIDIYICVHTNNNYPYVQVCLSGISNCFIPINESLDYEKNSNPINVLSASLNIFLISIIIIYSMINAFN